MLDVVENKENCFALLGDLALFHVCFFFAYSKPHHVGYNDPSLCPPNAVTFHLPFPSDQSTQPFLFVAVYLPPPSPARIKHCLHFHSLTVSFPFLFPSLLSLISRSHLHSLSYTCQTAPLAHPPTPTYLSGCDLSPSPPRVALPDALS